jgi:uncharacterized protein HemX
MQFDAGGGLMTARLILAAACCLAAVLVMHWRQMSAHKVTQVAMLSENTAAKKAHRIVADLYQQQTGVHHPAAPREGM